MLAETMFYVPAENRAKFWYGDLRNNFINLISFISLFISTFDSGYLALTSDLDTF